VAGHDGPGAEGGVRRGRAWPGDNCCPPAQNGLTPLCWASFGGHLETAQVLIEMGAVVNPKGKVRMRRPTPRVRESSPGPPCRIGRARRRGAQSRACPRAHAAAGAHALAERGGHRLRQARFASVGPAGRGPRDIYYIYYIYYIPLGAVPVRGAWQGAGRLRGRRWQGGCSAVE
jgi:hypothetical protein